MGNYPCSNYQQFGLASCIAFSPAALQCTCRQGTETLRACLAAAGMDPHARAEPVDAESCPTSCSLSRWWLPRCVRPAAGRGDTWRQQAGVKVQGRKRASPSACSKPWCLWTQTTGPMQDSVYQTPGLYFVAKTQDYIKKQKQKTGSFGFFNLQCQSCIGERAV